MTHSFFASAILIFTALNFSSLAVAQTPKAPAKAKAPTSVVKANPAPSATPAPTEAAPEAAPMNWKMSYFGEWQGPILGNIDLARTKAPNDPSYDYSSWDHYFKLGYAVSKNVVLGTQLRAVSPYDPAKDFAFKDTRIYASWNHMMETQDLDSQGVLKLELPTTDSSRRAGKLFALSFENNWTIKTSLRNWSFSAATIVRPYFYNDPTAAGGKMDLLLFLGPNISVDLTTNTQLLFEGSFDCTHNHNAAAFDFQSGDPDYVNIGPVFTINSHMNTNVALRFFMDQISVRQSALYYNISAAL